MLNEINIIGWSVGKDSMDRIVCTSQHELQNNWTQFTCSEWRILKQLDGLTDSALLTVTVSSQQLYIISI